MIVWTWLGLEKFWLDHTNIYLDLSHIWSCRSFKVQMCDIYFKRKYHLTFVTSIILHQTFIIDTKTLTYESGCKKKKKKCQYHCPNVEHHQTHQSPSVSNVKSTNFLNGTKRLRLKVKRIENFCQRNQRYCIALHHLLDLNPDINFGLLSGGELFWILSSQGLGPVMHKSPLLKRAAE